MAIYVRPKQSIPDFNLRAGEDTALPGNLAKMLKDQGLVWIVGGDASDFAEFSLEADADAGPAIHYPSPERGEAEVIKKGD